MIRSLIETSLLDWDGRITTVLFFDRCNFRCPFCQNWELLIHPERFPIVTWEHIEKILRKKKGWIDGVVLTGGEPLVSRDEVFDLAQRLKSLGFALKIDTNGAYPEVLNELIDARLVDYVAMDIKAPLDTRYDRAAGRNVELKSIKESIRILMGDVVDYEFRTTCVPGIIDDIAITDIGREIKGAKRWFLQAFVPGNAYKEEYRKDLAGDYSKRLGVYIRIAGEYVAQSGLRGNIQ